MPSLKDSISKVSSSENAVTYFWIALWFLIATALGILPMLIKHNLDRVFLSPSILWALAYLVFGAIIGFIFGVPTIISDAPRTDPLTQFEGQDTTSKTRKNIIRANTNLTQISDWFTKLLIGAGLVQFRQIYDQCKNLAAYMARGIIRDAGFMDYATVYSGAIIVYFLTCGFIFGYVIMRVILANIFSTV